MKSKVYFSKNITPSEVCKLYDLLGIKLEGKVAAKIHSGEEGNQNYLKPEFWKDIINKLDATVVEVILLMKVVEIQVKNILNY